MAVVLIATPAGGSNAPSYYPSGPQTNVSKQTLIDGGWTLCWSSLYGETDTLQNIYDSCTGASIIYAAGATNSDTYMLLAAGESSVVFSQTGYNETVENNGTYWYLNPTQSMGFAPTASIYQSSADTSDMSDPLRMSWHLGTWCNPEPSICGGWRVGATVGLNSSTDYERAIWHSGGAIVAQPAVSQEDYDALQAQYDQLSSLYATLLDDYKALGETAESINASYQEYVSWSEVVIADQTAVIEDQNKTINDLNSAIDSYKVTINDRNVTIAGYISKVDSLTEALAKANADIAAKKAELVSAEETINILKTTIDELNGKVTSTEEQLATALETLAKSKSDLEIERAKSTDLTKQLAASQARIEELEAKLATALGQIEELKIKNDTTQKQLDDALAKIDTLVKQLGDANTTIQEQRSKIDQLQAIVEDDGNAEQNLELAGELTVMAMNKFATAEKDSEEYEAALVLLAIAAEADDPDLPEELAALPVVGAVAGQVLEVMNDLGNIGADIAPEQRERAEEIVVASIIAGNIAVSAGASAPSGGARRKI
jgi:uncharacterized coiled-coil protein SlyX